MSSPRLLIRKVNESNQRENWNGYALFVQVPLNTTKGVEWLEKRLTPNEHASGDVAAAMVTGQKWAADNGFEIPKGWEGYSEAGIVGTLNPLPRTR